MRAQLTGLTLTILFASSIQVLPPLFKKFIYVFELFTFTVDVSSKTSTPHAPVLRLCLGLISLQCGLPLEGWDDHALCASCWALDDPLCGASAPALSALSGPRSRDSISWRCRASPPDKEVLHFFSPPRPELTFVLFSALGRSGPTACPLSACTTTVHRVYRPAALATRHPIFSASSFGLPGVSSMQRGGGGRFDPAFDGSCPSTWLSRACWSPLTLTSTG